MARLNVYYDPLHPGSFGGIQALQRVTKLPQKEVVQWLKEQDTYTLHRSARRKFKRDRIVVNDIDQQWEADLVDLKGISRVNQGFNYLLTVIDVLSKYAFVQPLKDKTGESIIKAFQHILKERQPRVLRTDRGTEFENRKFQSFLKDRGIHFFTSKNETKAAIVERFNRTLKNKMWRYFTYRNTRRYTDVLQDLVDSYNNTYHRSIKRTPSEVNPFNAHEVWKTLYGKESEPTRYKFNVGDTVRISKLKRTFEKGYLPNWTTELFRIAKQGRRYKLVDLQGEEIEGTFFEPELQKVTVSDDTEYKIEKVIRRRGKGKRAEAFVKWEGYSDKFNSWIPAKQLKNVGARRRKRRRKQH